MAYLLSYTRLPVDSVIYDPRLAYSMTWRSVRTVKITRR